MPPTREAKKPSERHMKTVTALQENIRLVAKEVREPVKTGKAEPSSTVKVKSVSEPPVTRKALVSKPGPLCSKEIPPARNPYAREIFFCKTNVREIARQEVIKLNRYTDPAEIAAEAKKFRYRLFKAYVETPEFRIRQPMDKLKFDSEYYEYRVHLALAMRMCSEEDYQRYREQLDAAGVAESWVSMWKDNLLLEHEEKVLKTVKEQFNHWGAKLDKLPEYLMQSQMNYEARQQAKEATRPPEPEQIDPLLDAIIHRSNTREQSEKPQEVYALLANNPPRWVCNRSLRWLVFDDDELNQRFGLGPYAVDDDANDKTDDDESETMIGISPLDQSLVDAESESVHSQSSEIAQMRSEMAMTQPGDMMLVPGGSGPFFQNTEEVITALEPTQLVEAFVPERIDALLPPEEPLAPSVDPVASQEGPPVSHEVPLVGAGIQEANPPDEPMPQQQPETSAVVVTAVATAPVDHQSGGDGSQFSLLTPGQQEVITLSEDDEEAGHPEADRSKNNDSLSDEIKLESGFWTKLDNLRRYTNVDDHIAKVIRFQYRNNQKKLVKKLAKLDMFVKAFFVENFEQLQRNELPDGVVKLTRRARREREAASQAPTPVAQPPPAPMPLPPPATAPQVAPSQSTPAPTPVPNSTPAPAATAQSPPNPAPMPTQSPPLVPTPEPLFNGALASQFDKPRAPLPTKIRRIAYDDDSPTWPPVCDSLDSTLPSAENFKPECVSTQVGGPMICAAPRPGTPRPSPRKQQPTPPRPQQRPSVDSRSSTPAFAADNPDETVLDRSPRKRPSPRIKAEPDTSGYEDDVEEVPINDAPIELDDSERQSQIDGFALIDGEYGVPLVMRPRSDNLFKNLSQQQDATLSQTPEKSSGEERRLSQDRQSVGFRSSQSPRVRSD